MASLRDLRRRIKGIRNTEKLTKAMELVAAARMRRAQERVRAARPYADEIASVVVDLMHRTGDYRHPYLQARPVQRRIVVLVTSDRGLCGAFNSNNIRLALRTMGELEKSGVVTLGRRGRNVMRRLHKDIVADVSPLGDRPSMGDILPALRVAMLQYEAGEADQVDVVFARFISAGKQQAMLQRVLPVEAPTGVPALSADFIYEPEPEQVLDALLPRYVESRVYAAVLDNAASEQAARMLAMRGASDNAKDLIGDLTLTGNKLRQSMITTELMEIVGGAAALQG